MLTYGLLRNRKVFCDLANCKFVASYEFQHVTPMGVGESTKNRIWGVAPPVTGLGGLRNAHFRRGLTRPSEDPAIIRAGAGMGSPAPRQRSQPG